MRIRHGAERTRCRPGQCLVLLAGMLLALTAGCGDPGVPLEDLIEEGEAERVVLATRIAEARKERDRLAKELEVQRQSNEVLRAEVLGLHGRLEERELRLAERDEMLQAVNKDLKATQQRLADIAACRALRRVSHLSHITAGFQTRPTVGEAFRWGSTSPTRTPTP